jgi:uncharacterized ferritin-like protein (DUF455 family)
VNTVRRQALLLLVTSDPHRKAALTRESRIDKHPAGAAEALAEPAGIPGRPARPELLPHDKLKAGSMATLRGRAALIHALAHIELNAIDLALDLTWRFAGLPEALHFELLRDHLRAMGYEYGDFPAHNALWEMAEKTKHDILARIALVPRTLEARGLDASPAVKAKLQKVGDDRGAEMLDLILRDEIGHVAVGNRWYRWLCDQRGLDHIATYADLAKRYGAPRPRGPFNLDARRAAGFDEEELTYLTRPT